MKNVEIKQISTKKVLSFFKLYKQIVNESFHEWTEQSKQHWLKEDFSLKFWTELLEKNEVPIFVAIVDGSYIGFAAFEHLNYGVAYLSWIGVIKTYQRQGIGDALMKTAITWCKKQKSIHKIELETQIPQLRSFYKKHGFEFEGVRKKSWQKLDNYMFGKIL